MPQIYGIILNPRPIATQLPLEFTDINRIALVIGVLRILHP